MATPLSTLDMYLRRLDRYQRTHRRAGFIYAVFRKYSEDESGHKAALLAYYGFLAIFPLLLVLTTILKLLLNGSPQLKSQIINDATAYFPAIGNDLQHNIHGLGASGVALVVGVLLTLYGARGVADVLRSALNHMWQVPYAQRSRFPGSIARSMSIITFGGFGLLAVPVVSGYALAFGHGEFFRTLSIVLTLIMLFVVLIFVIKIAVSVHRSIQEIWFGAAIAAMGLEVLQSVGGYILARELTHLDSLYGAFAIVLGLLYWLYLQAQLLLYAFEVDSVRIFDLWPRSLQKPLTEADHKAFHLYSARARFHELEQRDHGQDGSS